MKITRLLQQGGLALSIIAALSACNQTTQESPPADTQVSVMTLSATEITTHAELPGRVSAVRTAEIRPQVGGIVQRRLFEQGADVRSGQALFQINPAPFKAEADMAQAVLQRAQAALARAQVQATRLEPLVRADAVSRQVYDDAISQRDQAAADVGQAKAVLARRQLDLKFATVDAPINGRIDQALVTEGALVNPSDANAMALIQQIDQVYVDVRQPASALESLRDAVASGKLNSTAGNNALPATILRSNGEVYPLASRILFSGINVDAGTGDVLLRILVDNPQHVLLPGMFVRARVPQEHYASALLIPQQAVLRTGGKPQVWVLDDKDHARRIPVQLGEVIDRQYHVLSGLTEGQRIVVEGMERLTEGDKTLPVAWQSTHTNTEDKH